MWPHMYLLFWGGFDFENTTHRPLISVVQSNQVELTINGLDIPNNTQLQVRESCSIF